MYQVAHAGNSSLLQRANTSAIASIFYPDAGHLLSKLRGSLNRIYTLNTSHILINFEKLKIRGKKSVIARSTSVTSRLFTRSLEHVVLAKKFTD